jgi:hypothetical protein
VINALVGAIDTDGNIDGIIEKVGETVGGGSDGCDDGQDEGIDVGTLEGETVMVGSRIVGCPDGVKLGIPLGDIEGAPLGAIVGSNDGGGDSVELVLPVCSKDVDEPRIELARFVRVLPTKRTVLVTNPTTNPIITVIAIIIALLCSNIESFGNLRFLLSSHLTTLSIPLLIPILVFFDKAVETCSEYFSSLILIFSFMAVVSFRFAVEDIG